MSRPLDHCHGRPYTLGRLYKHVSHTNGERSSDNLALFFMGNFICVPVRQMHGSDRLRLMQNFLQILNFILICISLTCLIIVLIKAGYLYYYNRYVNRISLRNYYNLKLCLQSVLIRNMEI